MMMLMLGEGHFGMCTGSLEIQNCFVKKGNPWQVLRDCEP